jgi:hypothetical protein
MATDHFLVRSVLIAAALLLGGCQAPSVDLMPRLMRLDLDGDFAASSSAISAATTWDELGLDDASTVFSPRADLHMGPFDVTLDYAAADFSGQGTTGAQLELDGITIAAGTAVESDFDLAVWRLTSTYDFFPTEVATVGLGVGLAALDIESSVVNISNSDRITTDEVVPLPYLALRGGMEWGNLEAQGLLGLLSLDVGDAEASYVDLDLFLRYRLLGGEDHMRVSLVLGYRYADLDAEYDDGSDRVAIETRISGPYFGGSVTF